MDSSPMEVAKSVIDIESSTHSAGSEAETPSLSDTSTENLVSVTICGVDENTNIPKNVDKDRANSKKENINEDKRKSLTAKKPPKPPRPAKGLSLDAADRRLIKEISELAMMKRARIERIKKMKAAKGHSTFSASFGCSLIAVVFTVIFCIVVVFQGCRSPGEFPRNQSAISAIRVEGSHQSNGVALGNIIVQKNQQNLSSDGVHLASIESPDLANVVRASGGKDELDKAIHRDRLLNK